MNILLTNDDGILAPGLVALAKELSRLGTVTIVAPISEQSGVGHGLTFLSALKYRPVTISGQFWGWAIEGTPTDCVRIGIQALCESKPDIVVSGINSGYNAGINVHYSGTCSAAMEGCFFGITSFAVSLQNDAPDYYDVAARITTQIIEQTLRSKDASPQLYNLNIPLRATKSFLEGVAPEIVFTPTDDRIYGEKLNRGESPFGMPFYWCAANSLGDAPQFDSDLTALHEGKVTLTPLNFNMTNVAEMNRMTNWNLTVSSDVPPAEVQPDKVFPEIYIKRLTRRDK